MHSFKATIRLKKRSESSAVLEGYSSCTTDDEKVYRVVLSSQQQQISHAHYRRSA